METSRVQSHAACADTCARLFTREQCCAVQEYLSEVTGTASASSRPTFTYLAAVAASSACYAESSKVTQVRLSIASCRSARIFAWAAGSVQRFSLSAGRQAAKSWLTSIKIVDKTSANLGDWIKKQNHKLGSGVVNLETLIWLPAKRQRKQALIKSYDSEAKEHLLLYEDGSEEVLYLSVESHTLQGELDPKAVTSAYATG